MIDKRVLDGASYRYFENSQEPAVVKSEPASRGPKQLATSGFAAYALDHRGRGKSEGERFYVEKFSDWLSDVDKLAAIARSENPGVPVYMLGHSVGGVILRCSGRRR